MKILKLDFVIADDKSDIYYYVTFKYSSKHNKFVPTEVFFDYKNDLEVFESVDDLINEYPDVDKELVDKIDKTLDKLWSKKINRSEIENILLTT